MFIHIAKCVSHPFYSGSALAPGLALDWPWTGPWDRSPVGTASPEAVRLRLLSICSGLLWFGLGEGLVSVPLCARMPVERPPDFGRAAHRTSVKRYRFLVLAASLSSLSLFFSLSSSVAPFPPCTSLPAPKGESRTCSAARHIVHPYSFWADLSSLPLRRSLS